MTRKTGAGGSGAVPSPPSGTGGEGPPRGLTPASVFWLQRTEAGRRLARRMRIDRALGIPER
jgi:hypothetical protein